MKTGAKTLLIILLFVNAVSHAAPVKTLTVYFEKDKTYFTNGEAAKLAALKSADYVVLKGHTDSDGSDEYNLALSKKRVEAVEAYLHSIDAGIKVEADYFGERSPLNSNADEKEKTMNRRVEITYVSDPLMRTLVPELHYEIDNTEDRVIACPHGTKVLIPAGAFNNDCIQINISEYYSPAEIFAANLTTTSDNAPIETAGMIKISAWENGLRVEPSQPLQFKFPRKNKSEDFNLFDGVRDNALAMNWELKKTEQPKTATKKSKEGYTELKGWDTCEVLASGAFSAYLHGKGIDSFWLHVSLADKKLKEGCFADGAADITLNSNGKITLLRTKYEGKNTAWDKELRKFIDKYFPDKIDMNDCEASIHLEFGRKNTALIITGPGRDFDGANGFFNYFGKEYSADYETDNIILSTSKMGWINCDRFMNNAQLTTYKVNTDEDANVRLMMKKYNSFFANEFRGGEARLHEQNKTEYGFYRVPDNEEVVVICTKKVNGVLYLAIEPAKISSEPFKVSNYKAVTQDELEAAIKNLTI